MVFKWWQRHGLLVLVLILALGLRLPQLTGSFWLDEAAQALESARPWSQQLQLTADFQPPLLHLITAVAIRIGHSEWWLRTIGALIPGLVTIAGTYFIGAKLKNKVVGIYSALFLATSSFHIFYSQELRPYSLPVMWAVLSWLFLLKATDDKKWSRHWRLFTVFSLLGFYSSYLYPFLWLSQLVWFGWHHRKKWLLLVTSALFTVAGFAPWLPSFFKQLAAGTAVKANLPGWAEVVSLPQWKAMPLVLGKFLYGVINLSLNPVFALMTGLVAFLIGLIIYQNRARLSQQIFQEKLSLLMIWFVLPLITSWLISFIVPVVRPKRLLIILPAFYLLISYFINSAQEKLSQQLKIILLSLLTVINLFGFWQYSFNPNYQRENWRALNQEIQDRFPVEKTILLFSFPQPFAPWRWYDQGTYRTLSTGQLRLKTSQDLTGKIKVVTDYQYVLLFDYLRDLTDPEDQLRNELWALGFREINALDYPGLGFVRIFSKNKVTALEPQLL